jgi:HlyD family secretion protein
VVIRAPWAGVVSDIRVEAGQSVNAGAPILEIVDQSVVEIGGVVDEIDVLFVRVGAQASVTMDALPGQVLTGVVSDIAPSAESQQGVVSYPVSIRLQLPQGLELPEGLSAVAQVVLREDRNVLLVPLDALSGTFDRPIVRVMTDAGIVERPVVLGNSDEFWVVVSEGLAAGDTVVVEASRAATQGFGFGRGFTGGFGGGFGGGGRAVPTGPGR